MSSFLSSLQLYQAEVSSEEELDGLEASFGRGMPAAVALAEPTVAIAGEGGVIGDLTIKS